MPKLSDIRRIVPEDFSEEDRESAEKIAGSYNEFADELYQVINGQLDFDNLARNKVVVDISFKADGTPVVPTSVKTSLTSVSMLHIGNVQNMTNSSERLTVTPYLGWTFNGNGFVKIDYGISFQAGKKYRITLELIK
jgi:hypothetical protein